jgi:hypothetical protein
MKNTNATTTDKVQTVVTIRIGGTTYMVPQSKNVGQILEALSGLHCIQEENFYYVEPGRKVAVDKGDAEFEVAVSRREFVTEEECKTLRAEHNRISEEKMAKYRAEEQK